MQSGELALVLFMAGGVIGGIIMAFGDSKKKRVAGVITCATAMVILVSYMGVSVFSK